MKPYLQGIAVGLILLIFVGAPFYFLGRWGGVREQIEEKTQSELYGRIAKEMYDCIGETATSTIYIDKTSGSRIEYEVVCPVPLPSPSPSGSTAHFIEFDSQRYYVGKMDSFDECISKGSTSTWCLIQ